MHKKHLWHVWPLFILLVSLIMLPGSIQASDSEAMIQDWAIRIKSNATINDVVQATGTNLLGPIAHIERTWLISFPVSRMEQAQAILVRNQSIEWFAAQIKKQRFPREMAFDLVYSDPIFPYQWHLENSGQSGGTPGIDIHVRNVWQNMNILGNGVVIGIVDNGIQHTHPDLSFNYVASDSWDFVDNDTDPSPNLGADSAHGTAIAGLAAGRDNLHCGLGVAYRAGIAGLRLTSGPISDAQEAMALSYQRQSIDVYAYTWGPEDNGRILNKPGPLTLKALELNTSQGRNSLGNIYVVAAGNGNGNGDNVNYDGLASSRFTIAVGSVDHNGKHSAYSEPGAALMVVAPGSGDGVFLSGTDLQGLHGDSCGDCQDQINGTSASAAQVAGIIALMIETNPNLSWRDVQHLLIHSTIKNDPDDPHWLKNAAGLAFNPKYGFGLVDAEAAVKKAHDWTPVNPSSFIPYKKQVEQAIPDNNPSGITSLIDVNATTDYKLEHVEVVLNATHEYRGQLEITLTSPSGTQSLLAEPHTDTGENYASWTFTTVQNWEESIQGKWQLSVVDTQGGHTGKLISWELILHLNGEIGPLPPMARDDATFTAINTPVTLDILQNDFDPNGDTLTIINMTLPASGTVEKNTDQTITYTPDDNFLGQDQFQYTVSDGRGGEDTATVSITTVIIHDPSFEKGSPNPFWIEQSVQSDSVILASPEMAHTGKYLVSFKGGRNRNEQASCYQNVVMPMANHASLTFWLKIAAADVYGRFSVVVDDEVVFTISQIRHNEYERWRPIVVNLDAFADGKKHNIKFQANIKSGSGDTTFLLDDISMSIGSKPPVATNDHVQTEMNQPVIIDVLGNDYDANLDKITVTKVSEPQHGTAYANFNQTITYTPDSMFVGEDTFTYTINDQNGGSDTALVHVIIYTDKKLMLTLPEKVIEGEGVITGKLFVPEALTNDLVVQLISSDTSEIQCPLTQVTLQAGEKELAVQFQVVDDTEPDGFQKVLISASAQGWIATSVKVEVADNDVGPLLMVTPASAQISSQSGTIEFSVQNKGQGSMTWTAVCNQTWIRVISGQTGNNAGTITIQYDTNPNPTERTANLIVMAPDAQNSQITIPISQNKGTIEPSVLKVSPTELQVGYAENTATLSVENTGAGNMVWQARATVDWLIITDGDTGVNAGQIVVQYLTNTDDARQGTVQVTAPGANNSPVTILFKQEKGYVPKPVLHVSPDMITISEDGGTVSLTVTNKGDGQMYWHSATEASWLSIKSGKTGIDDGLITITCETNQGDARMAEIIIACAESTPPTKSVTIRQNECPPAVIAIEPKSVEVSGVNGIVKFDITNTGGGALNWTASVDQSWLEILSGASGINEGTIQVAYEKNIDDVRVGTLTVSSSDAQNQSVSAQIHQRTFGEIREKKLALGKPDDRLGIKVSMGQNLVIAGANMNDDRGINSGKAYIWRFNEDKWQKEASLLSSDGEKYDYFGSAVDISGNIAIVGAYGNDDNGSQSGSAYIFRYNNSSWVEEAKIVATDGYVHDSFGYAVAASASYIIVGANESDDLGSNSGAAYIFSYNADTGRWAEQVKLMAADGESYDNFACSVDIDGDYAIIGADSDDDHGSASGSAYIFKRQPNNNWEQQVKLIPNDGSKFDHFGCDVAISNHYAVVGAYADNAKGTKSGSAYVFENIQGSWQQVAKLIPADGSHYDFFGWSVAISGKNIIAGAYGDDNLGSRSGSAYIFQRVQEKWTEMKKICASDGDSNDYFAYAASIFDHYAIVGAYGDDDYGSKSGAVYVYDFRDALAFPDSSQPQSKQLNITQLPPAGNRIQDLKGCVTGLDTNNLTVNVFAKRNQWHGICVPAMFTTDGCWSCDITTAPYDHQVQEYFIFVLPQTISAPDISDAPLPEALFENAILMKHIHR